MTPDPAVEAYRYAVYLIPPYDIARPVAEIHHLLRKQFGFVAGDRFQVHATIKGFFKKRPGPLEPMLARLDDVFANQRSFPVEIAGLRVDPVGIGLNVSRLGSTTQAPRNEELSALRERVVDAVRPYIAEDCDFVERDLAPPFVAHITLAFRDIPVAMQEDVLAYLQDVELPSGQFVAQFFHFLAFHSEDWPGDWAPSLTWKLLKTWRLE